MSTFTEGFKNEANKKYTENGALAYKSTMSDVLDFFATVGALRQRSDADIIAKFDNAYAEDKVLATKILFYGRDIRGGCGERRMFRVILKHCAQKHPEAIKENLDLIGVYGRYDDMYALVGTPCEDLMWTAMKKQWEEDVENYNKGNVISLLAKWIKTPDSKSNETRKLGILTCRKISDGNIYTFKRLLRKLRKHIDIVETHMCNNEWTQIKYSAVPSRAMTLYRKAFTKHDFEGFNTYIENVSKGVEKINAGTLYPYDIVRPYVNGISYYNSSAAAGDVDKVLEEQWKAQPNYVVDNEGKPKECNIIVMADVSGSMFQNDNMPISSAIGLGIYFAQRNRGAFHNLLMTFSRLPAFINIKEGDSLYKTVRLVAQADWGQSTDFMEAMRAILHVCVENKVAPEDVPEALVCISDMEFDAASRRYNGGVQENIVAIIDKEFEVEGYKRPNLVFWNVAARNDTFHLTSDMGSAILVSGQSASAFKMVINSLGMTPYEAMLLTINSDRYEPVTVAE